MESFLQTAGLDGNVLIPADAAWELQQKGIDLAEPLGWDMADMEESAALGHDIVMPVARLQARLQPEAMKAVADIMRESPNARNAADTVRFNENLPSDLDGLVEQVEDDALERSAIEGELERLHDELTAAVTSSPHLMAQITSTVDGDTSVGQYVDTQLGLIVRRARQLTRMGIPMSDTLSRFSFQGLVKDENGRMVTPEEAEALAQRNAEEEALAPFWDEVWGRLNPDSLRTDFPDARRELAYRHGRGLFARKGEGVAVDELADELKSRGLLEADADSSTLIERLKDLPRPSRRGAEGRGVLNQAMAQSQADSLESFIEGARKGRIEFWKSDVVPSRLREIFNDRSLVINIPYDYVQHLDNRRHAKTDELVANTEKIISEFDDLAEVISSSDYPNKRFIVAKYDGDMGTLVVFDRVISRKRGHRLLPVTAYTNRAQVIRGIVEKEKTLVLGPAISGQDTNIENDVIQGMSVLKEINISQTSLESNTLFQTAPAPQASIDIVRRQYEDFDSWMKEPNDKAIQVLDTFYQGQTVTSPEAKLAEDVRAWAGIVDGLTKKPREPQRMLSQTPLVFHLLGADFREVYAAPHVFDGMFPGEAKKGHNTHPNIDADILKQLPAALADPIAVFGSDTVDGRLVFMVDVTDANGATVILPVQLDAHVGSDKANMHIVTSAYSKEKKGVPNNRWFETQAGNLLYVNRKKEAQWVDAAGSNSLWSVSTTLGKKNILTEADLVKLKNQYPGYYQTVSSALGSTTRYADGQYVYPDNGQAVGSISPEIARTLRLDKPGAIVLDDTGLRHIEERHGKEIRSLGFHDGLDFVNTVLTDVDAVYAVEGSNRKYDLVSRAMKPQGRVMIRLEFAENGDFYRVETAGPLRPQYYNKKIPLWERAQSNHSTSGTPDAISGQSGELRQDAVVSINLAVARQRVNSVSSSSALGSTTRYADGQYVIRLFRGANLSTLTHETAHVFFLEMERLEREGLADARMLADLAALREWTADFDDDILLKEEYDRYQKHQVYGGADFEALPGFVKESVRNRAKQERLARGFEQYLREGKAPSKRLEGVFARFRKWLMRVYRDALDLHVELTDEVRDVFDRMLAHESEMDLRAEAANVREETSRLLDVLDLKGTRRLEIEGLITSAKDEAAERLRHARDADRQQNLRTWTKEARKEVEREQVYMTRKALRRTPIDLASFNDVNGEELGRELVRKLPGAARRAGGVEPEVFAAEHGYASAAAMARDIMASPTTGQRIRQLVDERQAEHDALFDAEAYLFEQEQLAEQQERLSEALVEKLRKRTAERQHRREVKDSAVGGKEVRPAADENGDFGTPARWSVGRDQLRTQARAVLQKKPLGEAILPEQFRRAASRWMQEERRAILKEDFETALQANYRARINIELARQAARKREQVEKLGRKAKRFVEMSRADSDARFAVFVLSQNVGLFPPTRSMLANAGDKGLGSVEAFARRMREFGFMGAETAFDGRLFTSQGAWKDMTWEAFRPYAETMTMIMHMERESRTVQTAQGRVDIEEPARAIAESLYADTASPETLARRNEAAELLKRFHAAHLKADTIAMLLDGDTLGPAWSALARPVNEATWKQAERLKRERDTLKKLFSVYSRRELAEMKGKRLTIPGVPDVMTKEQALAVLLNCGNTRSRERLMTGQSLTEAELRSIIDTLDERDVRFAQSVWDYFETFRKESSDLEESLTGVRPESVQAKPVQTRFGTFRGGYYPVSHNRNLSTAGELPESSGAQAGALFPSAEHSATQRTTGTPLSLSLDVIPRHVAETVHTLAFRRPVMEVAKLLRHREVDAAIRKTAGVATAKALDDWLHAVAGERPVRNGWDRTSAWARKNAALYAMGFRLSTMLAQATGLRSASAEIGPRWALRGVTDTYGRGNPLEVWRTVMELSPMMRNRIAGIEHEVFERSSGLMKKGAGRMTDPFACMKAFMDNGGAVPPDMVELFWVELPTWAGAYARALEEHGGDIGNAARYADTVVKRVQMKSSGKDFATVQRGHEPGRLMTMFYSCFSALYNLSARRTASPGGRKDAAGIYRLGTLALLTWFAEPVLAGLLKGGMDEEEPDAENWMLWGAKEAFFNPFNMVIDVRDMASMLDFRISDRGGYRRSGSASGVFDSTMRFGAEIGRLLEEPENRLTPTAGKARSTGFTSTEAMRLLAVFWNWLDETTPEMELGNVIRKNK